MFLLLSESLWIFECFPRRKNSTVTPIFLSRWLAIPAAGGTSDANARPIVQEITKSLGQSVVIENRPDANGTLVPRQWPSDARSL